MRATNPSKPENRPNPGPTIGHKNVALANPLVIKIMSSFVHRRNRPDTTHQPSPLIMSLRLKMKRDILGSLAII